MELRLELELATGSDPVPDRGNSKKRSLALREQTQESPFSFSNRNGGFVVGWPPVRSWRKQLCQHNRRVCGGGGGRAANSVYVKVKMEGVGITRKIDLSVHRSHRTLANKLISLFGKCQENGEYKLMFQNKEGEWLEARDVPWECFMKSVQRLKLEKINGY